MRAILPISISSVFFILYVSMQTLLPYAGDSGGLVAAACTWGIAHPPGYPLYSFLGAILCHIPLETPAFRVGLLSSLPMAVSLWFLFGVITMITKKRIGAVVGVIVFGLLYPTWLYSIVPEVFGLFMFFSSAILYMFLSWVYTRKDCYWYWSMFLIGLAFTHHHLILILCVSIGFFLYRSTYARYFLRTHLWKTVICFLSGLLVYIYAPIVSSYNPPFDWEHPAQLSGFFRLVTRASYGTFRASFATGQFVLDRIFNVLTFFQYVWKDFTPIGVVFILMGGYFLWKQYKNIARMFFFYAALLLFYFFYAGFPVSSDFSVGTIERFFIAPYQLFSLFLGIGIIGVYDVLQKYWRTQKAHTHMPFIIIALFFWSSIGLLVFGLIFGNFKKLNNLKHDKTLSYLADDLLLGVPEGAMLNLSDDLSIFAMDYAYYVEKKRQDVLYVSFPMLRYPVYRKQLKMRYPHIIVPVMDKLMTEDAYIASFIKANASVMPVINERTNVFVPEFWIPQGLVMRYYSDLSSIPDRESILEKNRSLWQTMHDPLQGALGKYKHMMLMDVLRYYAKARFVFVESLLLAGKTKEAKKEIEEALRLLPNRYEFYIPYALVLISLDDCKGAYDAMVGFGEKYEDRKEILHVFHEMYLRCPMYKEYAGAYEKEYEKSLSSPSSDVKIE